MRVSFTRAEVDALAQAIGEVTADEMDTWTTDEADALDSACLKLIKARRAAACPKNDRTVNEPGSSPPG